MLFSLLKPFNDDYGMALGVIMCIMEFSEGVDTLEIPDTWDFSVPTDLDSNVPRFRGEWDTEGVYFYQAYRDEIADWALENQRLGGPYLKVERMTWIKPSFGWMLYRCGYARKNDARRVLKIKLPHEAVSDILAECTCKERGGGTLGRVQWDPDRDIMTSEKKEPRKMLRQRAIQIGVKGPVAQYFRHSIICIQDVTALAHEVGDAHRIRSSRRQQAAMRALSARLPRERPYLPYLPEAELRRLGLLKGETAENVASLGRGKARRS